jgi:hypothetical protein
MDNHGYVDPFDLQSEITFAHVVFASCAGFPLAAVFGSDDIVCPRKRAMNHSEGKEPIHVTQEMRKAGILALLEIDWGAAASLTL